MTDITVKRACEVLRAEGYNDAAQYLNTWAAMPPDLRAVYPEPNQPAVVELAERLAKVEDRLANTRSAHIATLDQRVVDERLKALDDRITKVAEIIGERVSGLVDELAAACDSAKRAHERLDEANAGFIALQVRLDRIENPAFPTGGASTAEAAADAVLPVPQRGDRVRLEGAIADTGRVVPNGWYDVIGHSGGSDEPPSFQIEAATQFDFAKWVPWLYYDLKTLKEVRHAEHT